MRRLVKQFQCPGCGSGSDTHCGSYNFSPQYQHCMSHVLGTVLGLGNTIALGLPKGFNKPGLRENFECRNRMDIRLWEKDTYPEWDRFNIAVWAMKEDGFLFVRTYAPRINHTWVDVIEGGALELCPGAVNVAEFIDEID